MIKPQQAFSLLIEEREGSTIAQHLLRNLVIVTMIFISAIVVMGSLIGIALAFTHLPLWGSIPSLS